MTMIFIDTEFVEKTLHTEQGSCQAVFLLSIALYNEETGSRYYAVCDNVDKVEPGEFVRDVVIPKLGHPAKLGFDCTPKSLEKIREEVLQFVGTGERTFAGYYCDYDWVVLASLFGSMINMPRGWGYHCYDIQQFIDDWAIEKSPLKMKVANELEDHIPHCALCDVTEEVNLWWEANNHVEEVFGEWATRP